MPRSAVAIFLPPPEFDALRAQLADGGYEAVAVGSVRDLHRLLRARDDIRVAILDGETDFDGTLEMYEVLHEGRRNIPALLLMPPRALGRMGLAGRGHVKDEYFSRPYSADSLRWRIEAMLIRVENVPAPESTATVLAGGAETPALETMGYHDDGQPKKEPRRGKILIVFNPKGGVGKTTISINLGASMQMRRGQKVLLVDCDTITGHIATSLGIENARTLATAWRNPGESKGFPTVVEVASVHASGVSVLVMAESPLHTEPLEPQRVAEAVAAARDSYDWLILDMHPDYGQLNQALFALADKILIPVTPDLPCIRAAVQLREVAVELQVRDRLSLVINRANSGIAASDVERVVAVESIGRVRSAGMLFVRAADEGKSVVERFPTAKVNGDIDALADRLIAGTDPAVGSSHGLHPRGRLTGSVRDFLGRLTAQVS
ncbi:MAG: CpaE family protein [Candidatus Limnocylindrales bacterium]